PRASSARFYHVGYLDVHTLERPSPFDSTGDPRDLHSFPTRRSSDLGRRAGQSAPLPSPDPAGPAGGCLLSGQGSRNSHVEPLPGDRKSTRLNSSHVKISYAVFCLKKKMII